MISLPAGSGKTRVAVQAIVEAIGTTGSAAECSGSRTVTNCASRPSMRGRPMGGTALGDPLGECRDQGPSRAKGMTAIPSGLR